MKDQLADLPGFPPFQSSLGSRPSGSLKRSHLVITIVVAVLICVFSVAAAQAVDPRDKGQATVKRILKTISPLSPIRHTLATLREALAGLVPARSTGV